MEIHNVVTEAVTNKLTKPILERLQAEQIASLHRQVGSTLTLSPRLERLVNNPAAMKSMDADDLIDAFAKVIDRNDVALQNELLALTVTVARMGSVLMAMRLGLKMFEEVWAEADEEASV